MNVTNIKNNGMLIPNPNNNIVFKQYLGEINKFKALSREEELETFKLVKKGDLNAYEKICKHNLLFVVSIAKQYSKVLGGQTAITLEDLISEGNIGLMIAIDKFNYDNGNKFISYAVWWIKQTILAHIQNNIKGIRLPSSIRLEVNKINKKEEYLEQKLSRKPTTVEIFEEMLADSSIKMIKSIDSPEKIDELLKMTNFEISLSSTGANDSPTELSQLLECENPIVSDTMMVKERIDILRKMLTKLPPKTQSIFSDYFGLDGEKPLTLKEIGVKHGVTSEAIRITINKYLRKLKFDNKGKEKFLFPR
jgi:RNA polymerase primary sigma factor